MSVANLIAILMLLFLQCAEILGLPSLAAGTVDFEVCH